MAMTTCRECKKDVSMSAKICPHCGVKNPANRKKYGVVVVLIIAFFVYKISSGDSPPDKDAAKNPDAVAKTCGVSDGQCIFDKYWIEASIPCRNLVEKSSKYDYEWTDGMFDPMFTHFRNNPQKKTIVLIGDKVKFTNGFNAKTNMTYSCTYDLDAKQLVDFDISEGRL